MISIDEMAKAVVENLDKYKNLAADELKKAVKSAAKTVISEIKEHAPVKTGTYAKSWKSKTTSENARSAELSADMFRLAHLLEKGHAKRGGGRVKAFPHIAPAEEKGAEQLERDIKAALKA